MASKPYEIGIANILESTKNLEGGSVKVILVKGTYVFSATHDFYDDVSAYLVSGTSAKTLTTSGTFLTVSTSTIKFDADDPSAWTAVTDADGVGGAVVYYDTGVAGTSPLLAFIDATDLETNGSNVTLTFSASGIFTITCTSIWPLGLANILGSTKNLEDGNVKVILLKGTYSYSNAHDFYDDVSAYLVSGTAAKTLSSPAVTAGSSVIKFDATDPATWSAVTDTDGIGAMCVYYDTGTPSTSPILAFVDGTDLTANGSDINGTFSSSGIFTVTVS